MEYTEKDRSLLINLYEILKRLDKDNEDSYEEEIEILRSGYEIFYRNDVYEPMSREASEEVLEILEMYWDFEYAYEREDERLNNAFATFPGFCGNYEGAQLRFARFVIEKQKKFPQLGKYVDDLNSHVPLLPFYRLMLDVWKEYPREYRSRQLKNDDVLHIIERAEKVQKSENGHG